ncbi:MAG: MFS transporter [Gammaproteobacteria bacterium]|nr:MFS transporter [Gammaproteobacteria bacterium]
MRNVWILTLAQAFAACGTITLVTFGGIVGTHIAPAPALATLPLSMSVLGLAGMSLPAALLMQRIGRKRAFIGSAFVAAIAALLCAWAVAHESFVLFCFAGLLIGSNMAFVQQYRFAAIEYAGPADSSRAVSTVMIGTLIAAFVGPMLGGLTSELGAWPQYTASFLSLSVLCVIAAAILALLPAKQSTTVTQTTGDGRSIRELLRDPRFNLAVLAGLSSYAVMSFIMTATPLSMHVHDDFSTAETTTVITAHLLGMYLPSLATPWFVARLGVRGMMLTGIGINLFCVVVCAFVGHQFIHYFAALLLLGVGWNLLFVGATTLLSSTYTPEERFRAQGFNDFAVFSSQAFASLSAGAAIETMGWQALNLVTLPLLFFVLWSLRRVDVAAAVRT